jgi:hypothetical protein
MKPLLGSLRPSGAFSIVGGSAGPASRNAASADRAREHVSLQPIQSGVTKMPIEAICLDLGRRRDNLLLRIPRNDMVFPSEILCPPRARGEAEIKEGRWSR